MTELSLPLIAPKQYKHIFVQTAQAILSAKELDQKG